MLLFWDTLAEFQCACNIHILEQGDAFVSMHFVKRQTKINRFRYFKDLPRNNSKRYNTLCKYKPTGHNHVTSDDDMIWMNKDIATLFLNNWIISWIYLYTSQVLFIDCERPSSRLDVCLLLHRVDFRKCFKRACKKGIYWKVWKQQI